MSRVDVIVPSHNYGHFLRQSVESALSQTGVDVRVLIIDDASQDDTERVCAEIVQEHPRVEVIRHPVNMGHVATFNDGIERARGDYMLLLSADDYLPPGALARAAAVLDADPGVGLAPGDIHILWPREPSPGAFPEGRRPKALTTRAAIERFAWHNFVAAPTAVVRTSVQKALGGYRPEIPHTADLELWLRFALASRITYVRWTQAVYRRHPSNMSKGYDDKADFDQSVAAFRLNLDAIDSHEQCGPSLVTRIDEIFAERAAALAGSSAEPGSAPFFVFPARVAAARSALTPPYRSAS